MSRARLLSLTLVVVLAVPVAAARAGIYTQVLHAYQTHGSIPPCQFTSPQLESALKGIDTYGAQYFQDFSTAVQSALSARAGGACLPARARGHVAPAHASPGPPLHLGPLTRATRSSAPFPLILLACLAAALMLAGGVCSYALWRGWSPRWHAAWRHGWSEAGYRAAGQWFEFADWMRSGSRRG